MKISERLNEAFKNLPTTVKFSYFMGALGIVFNLPIVPNVLLFLSFFITCILFLNPICQDTALNIRMWAIQKYPEEYAEWIREKQKK